PRPAGLGRRHRHVLQKTGLNFMDLGLKNKVAMVGGASKGLGYAVARTLAADLSTGDAIERWHAATLEQFGGVDLLFANTGGPPAGTPLSFDDNTWHAAFDLLVMSVVRTVRLV